MPFVFIFMGVVMVVSSVRGTNDDLAKLLRNDFTGQNNFIYWAFSILVLGAMGYVKAIQPATRMFMLLVVVALFLSNKGVFAQLQKALAGTQNLGATAIQPTGIQTGTAPTLNQQIAGLGNTNSQAA